MRGRRAALSGRVRRAKGNIRRSGTASGSGTGTAVCVLFLAVVVVGALAARNSNLSVNDMLRFIGRDTDFAQAFAAVGRAVSGKENAQKAIGEAFTAVFGPEDIPTQDTQQTHETEQTQDMQQTDQDEAAEKTQAEPPDASGIYSMQQLPENASLEQRNLGFSYTTPVAGTLTSAFGWREHPSEGGTRFHYGLDLAAEYGTQIVAFADGEVFAVGESSTLGKYIIIKHAGDYRTLYAHCSEIVVTGGSVRLGDIIARVGESGSATGAHLHFELQDGTLYLNPIYYVAIW